jgi:hypothetical protein
LKQYAQRVRIQPESTVHKLEQAIQVMSIVVAFGNKIGFFLGDK